MAIASIILTYTLYKAEKQILLKRKFLMMNVSLYPKTFLLIRIFT